ncbi:hypothetical protein AKJ51_02665, partial [candidate division MSBL1 archaeon SCGC-AAA382A20]
ITSPHFKYYDNPQKEKQKSEFTERRNFKMGGVIINGIPDYAADKSVGKRTIPVRIGTERAVHLYILSLFLVYLSVLAITFLGDTVKFTLIALSTIPLSVKSAKVAIENYHAPSKMVFANFGTYLTHFLTGSLLILGYFISGF